MVNSMRQLIAAGLLVATAFLARHFLPPKLGNKMGLTCYTPEATRYVPFRVAVFWLLMAAASVKLIVAGLRIVNAR
jgi:hypothetical protein